MIIPVSLILMILSQIIIAAGIIRFAVISGNKCAGVFSTSSMRSVIIVFNFSLEFLSKYPMGTLINLSQTAHLISFSVKYAVLCDMSVEKFKKSHLLFCILLLRLKQSIFFQISFFTLS